MIHGRDARATSRFVGVYKSGLQGNFGFAGIMIGLAGEGEQKV